jgi:arylsulfatase A-like enzyme
VPLIVRAKGKIAAGQTNLSAWAFWDVLPTIGELTGTASPKNIDGLSFSPLLSAKKTVKHHEYLYWQFNEAGLKEALTRATGN